MHSQTFIESLKKTKDFGTVYDNGRKAHCPYFVLIARSNGLDVNRLGVSVSKKVGNAVIRNRTKRIIKESFRLRANDIKPGHDIVVVARPVVGTLQRDGLFSLLDKSLLALLKKRGLTGLSAHG